MCAIIFLNKERGFRRCRGKYKGLHKSVVAKNNFVLNFRKTKETQSTIKNRAKGGIVWGGSLIIMVEDEMQATYGDGCGGCSECLNLGAQVQEDTFLQLLNNLLD